MSFNFNTILMVISAVLIAAQVYRAIFLPPAGWTQPSRGSAENKLLASWQCTGAEWARYLNGNTIDNETLKNFKGAVKLELTSKYFTLTNGSFSNRIVIDGKCVRTIDCAITGMS